MTGKAGVEVRIGSPAGARGPANPVAPQHAPLRGFMARLGPAGRGLFLVLNLLLVAVPSLAPLFPRKVTPASAVAVVVMLAWKRDAA
jgi:hypothetical protein